MHIKRILISTARWTSSRAIMESLGKQGNEIYLVDSNPTAASFSSKYCTRKFISPDESEKKLYVGFIFEILKNNNIDLFIPMSDLDIDYFSEVREGVERYTKLILPPAEMVRIARNKDETYRFCEDHGFKIPKTFYPASIQDVENAVSELKPPYLAKYPIGTGNEGNRYFQKKEWMINFYKNLDRSVKWPVIQEFIKGDVYGFSAVCDHGKVLGCFMISMKHKHSVAMPPVAYVVKDPKLFSFCARILSELRWSGGVNIDLIREPDGDYKLMEINPRFGGTVCFAYRCGVDLPYILFCMAFGYNIPSFENKCSEGTMIRNMFPGEILYCVKDRSYLVQFLKNFFVKGNVVDLNWRDPGLVFGMIRKAFVEAKDEIYWRLKIKSQSWGKK